MPIDVLGQVLDDDLAAELLAKEADVRPDHRTEIEQDWLRPRTQARHESGKDFRRMYGGIRCTSIGIGGFLTAKVEEIGGRHRRDDDTEIPGRCTRLPERPRGVPFSTPTRNRCGDRRALVRGGLRLSLGLLRSGLR